MAKRTLITSALPYANGSIHLGHLVEYIQTDVFVRFKRLLGDEVVYVCADDTHGTPIEINAKKQGIKPEELIAKYHVEHLKDFNDFLIEFDSYYSTNSPENKKFSDLVFTRAKEKGYIYTKDVEQTYCENCKRFLPDRFVKGTCPKCDAEDQYGDVCEACNTTYKNTELVNPKCSICSSTPNVKSSKHYFFKLSALSDKLKKWITENKHLQKEIKNFVLNWIKEGLQDWDISRDGPYFGFKIPGEENKYYYVWLDAPIGYIASTENYCKQNNKKVEDYWNSEDCEITHFIGKDITYFHLLFWPACLMVSDFNLPTNIAVHGFLTVNGEKMSKSRGTFLLARDYLNKFDPEYLRFYYTANLNHGLSDLDLNFDDFKERINNELVANIGNFIYRVLSFTNKNFDSKIIEYTDTDFEKQFDFEAVKKLYDSRDFREAVKGILHISTLGNRYFQDNAPWKLIKEDREKAHQVITECVNLVKNLGILLKPILPKVAAELEKQLKLKRLSWSDLGFDLKNHEIGEASILVNKIEGDVKLTDEKQFSQLNVKVAKVEKVMAHPNADKLMLMRIDLGDEKRQIVAGLKKWYSPDDLVGKNLLVITNLEHGKLRGEVSEAMLLAADDEEKSGKVQVLTALDASPGDQVYVPGVKPSENTISFKDFQSLSLKVENGKIICDGDELQLDSSKILVDGDLDNCNIR